MSISVLDCTLRDGGFVNNWAFGHVSLINIYLRLANAGIEIVELGFLNDSYTFNKNASIMPKTEDFNRIYDIEPDKKPMLVGMVILGECRIDNIGPAKDSMLDAIRIVFKKQNIAEGLEYCRRVIEKGYQVSVQPAAITDYTEQELIDLLNQVNALNPYAVYIVDTYGLMHKDTLLKYFRIMDQNMPQHIKLGYHPHNNFNVAYANATELFNQDITRDLIVDTTVYGMGKGAGNANTELVTYFLNAYYNKNYDIANILEIINIDILDLYKKYGWGYSFEKFVSAANMCHPKYVDFLVGKNTLPINAINSILSQLTGKDKTNYNEPLIKTLYKDYMYKDNRLSDDLNKLKTELSGKDVLILCPGKNITKHKADVANYIDEKKPTVVSANFFSRAFACDYILVSNAKRYSGMYYQFAKMKGDNKIITTTNVSAIGGKADYVLNADDVKFEDPIIKYNSALILIRICKLAGVGSIAIAGFDGYTEGKSRSADYVEGDFSYKTPVEGSQINALVKAEIEKLDCEINFLTPSLYSK